MRTIKYLNSKIGLLACVAFSSLATGARAVDLSTYNIVEPNYEKKTHLSPGASNDTRAQHIWHAEPGRTGDMLIPLGKFHYGTIVVDIGSDGQHAESSGRFLISKKWGDSNQPRIVQASGSFGHNGEQLTFWGYVPSDDQGYFMLYLAWDSRATNSTKRNDLSITVRTNREPIDLSGFAHDITLLGDDPLSANLVSDALTGRVGIGVWKPESQLDIWDSATETATIRLGEYLFEQSGSDTPLEIGSASPDAKLLFDVPVEFSNSINAPATLGTFVGTPDELQAAIDDPTVQTVVVHKVIALTSKITVPKGITIKVTPTGGFKFFGEDDRLQLDGSIVAGEHQIFFDFTARGNDYTPGARPSVHGKFGGIEKPLDWWVDQVAAESLNFDWALPIQAAVDSGQHWESKIFVRDENDSDVILYADRLMRVQGHVVKVGAVGGQVLTPIYLDGRRVKLLGTNHSTSFLKFNIPGVDNHGFVMSGSGVSVTLDPPVTVGDDTWTEEKHSGGWWQYAQVVSDLEISIEPGVDPNFALFYWGATAAGGTGPGETSEMSRLWISMSGGRSAFRATNTSNGIIFRDMHIYIPTNTSGKIGSPVSHTGGGAAPLSVGSEGAVFEINGGAGITTLERITFNGGANYSGVRINGRGTFALRELHFENASRGIEILDNGDYAASRCRVNIENCNLSQGAQDDTIVFVDCRQASVAMRNVSANNAKFIVYEDRDASLLFRSLAGNVTTFARSFRYGDPTTNGVSNLPAPAYGFKNLGNGFLNWHVIHGY